MTVTELLGQLQALELLGHGDNKITVWDDDNLVAKHIKGIDTSMLKYGYLAIDASVLPV